MNSVKTVVTENHITPFAVWQVDCLNSIAYLIQQFWLDPIVQLVKANRAKRRISRFEILRFVQDDMVLLSGSFHKSVSGQTSEVSKTSEVLIP